MKGYKYTMYVYKRWDGEFLRKEGSNSLSYFDRYKGKENFRIIIKEGENIIYKEV